jgi:transposase
VVPRATRRTFTAEYKLRILKEAEACTAQERGALLRREGLYASHLTRWRQQREKGSLAGLATQKRGPKQDADRAKARRIAELEREVEQLKARLDKAETVIEVQKNLRSAWLSDSGLLQWREQLIEGVEELSGLVGTAEACRLQGHAHAFLRADVATNAHVATASGPNSGTEGCGDSTRILGVCDRLQDDRGELGCCSCRGDRGESAMGSARRT